MTPGTGPAARAGRPVRADRTISRTWALLPADASSVAVDPRPGDRPAIERSLAVQALVDEAAGSRAFVTVRATAPPMALAFDVHVRQGGRSWPVGSVVAEPAAAARGRSGWVDAQVASAACPGLRPGRADVELRPAPTAAVRTVHVDQIWGGEPIVVKDVPVLPAGLGR